MRKLALLAAFACSMASASQASVTVDFTQSGADVVAVTSGSLDLTGITPLIAARSELAGIVPAGPVFLATNTDAEEFAFFRGLSGPTSFGTGLGSLASSSSGNFFGIGGTEVVFAPNYASGAPINAVTTFANSTFASLGLTPGSYVFTAPNDTITINIPTAVPEPGTWALMLMGFGAVGYGMRRKRAHVGVASPKAAA